MADIVTRRELEDAKIDAKDLGKAANEKVIVSPRYGEDFKSIPLLSDEFQGAIEAAAAAGAGANGWTDLLVLTQDGSTQRAKNSSFQSQINDKASTAYVDAQDAVKADKSYVDAQDTSLQSQINQKATAAYLDNALSQQTQTVNTALSQLSTAANKFYPTLAEANADIANISVNQPVQVGESGANGGLWYKATAGATNLTKSPYDPLTQAILRMDANPLFEPVSITSGMFSNIDNIKTSGLYICNNNTIAAEISGLPTSGRGFVLSVINTNTVTRQDISHIGDSFLHTRTSSVAGVFPAFGRLTTKTESDAAISLAVQDLKDSLVYEDSINLYNSTNAVINSRLNSAGSLASVVDAKRTGFIPVIEGQTYTASWSNTVSDGLSYAFFASNKDITGFGYAAIASVSPKQIVIPTGAKFIVFTLKQGTSATERLNFQLELGSTATAYKPWASLGFKLRSNLIASDIMRVSQFSELQEMNPKDYEKLIQSVNLFDESKIIYDMFLSSVNGALSAGTGWKVSGFIPVEAGKQYTLSGTRARQGISFFATNAIDGSAALLYDATTTLPLTVTAPAGANYAVIALESATAKGWDKLQFELGSIQTEYIPHGSVLFKVMASSIDGLDAFIPNVTKKSTYSLVSGVGVIKSGLLELGVRIFNPVSYDASAVFNFNNDSYNANQIRLNGDDVAPVRMMGATIGANHGYTRTILTLSNHGKTNADVGSVWTNGTHEWVIIQIISVNQLAITCRTLNIAFPSGNTLTHVSGATNTASFTPTAVTARQWYPMLKNHSVKLYADGNQITDTTINSGYNKSLKVVESYDLMEKSDIVEWLIGNGGKEVKSYSAASALNVSHVHSFDTTGGDTIYANFFTYKDLSAAQDLMFTQAARLKPTTNGLIKYYVPRSVAFVHESVSYDFSKPTNVNDLTISARINFDTAKTEVGAAVPDRLVMLNDTMGFAVGYLPILDALPSVRNSLTSKGIQISNSEAKVYPYLVDGLTTLSAGANYSCVAYRKYFKRPDETKRISEYDVQSDYGNFLFLDWQGGDFKDTIILPEHLQNKSFEVVEKTDNVVLLTKVATGQISVLIGTVTSNARLILKFK